LRLILARDDFAPSPVQRLLERAQEVDDVLALFHAQPIEALDGVVRLAIGAPVILDCLDEVGCSPVMQEKDTLPNAPERRGPKLIRTCTTLRDAVCKASAHVVNEKVRKQVYRLVGQRDAG
jgi:hypothetical protein